MNASGRAGDLLAHWEGEPVRVWSALWNLPRLEVYGRISSTNDRVREMAEDGAPTFSAVVAEEQSAGRGRGGRVWQAPRGSSLLISFLLRPPGGEARALTPLVVGIAVARAVEDVGAGQAAIKWPNDVLLRGKKAAGILCEAGVGGGSDAVVAGIGINVRQRATDFPSELRGRAVSLEMAKSSPVPRAELAGRLATRVREIFSPGPETLDGELAEELTRRDALRGRKVVAEDGLRGRAAGMTADGLLVLETAEGRRRVAGGTLRTLDEPDS